MEAKISQNIEKTNYLNRRISTAIEDLPRLHALDRRHFCSELRFFLAKVGFRIALVSRRENTGKEEDTSLAAFSELRCGEYNIYI